MLEVQSLTVTYGDIVALREFSLRVEPGEVFALIGPNGAGKSTLIRAVSGILRGQSGTISSQGMDLASLSYSQRARLIAVVPQARQQGGAFTVEQAVLMGRTAYMSFLGKPSEEDLAQARLAMEKTALIHLAQRRIAELSGGEQQRVLLARALAQTTPILLLDEPTNHLDLQHQSSLLSLIRELVREKELAVLMAMHDLNMVSLYADRVALLVAGELQAQGAPKTVLTSENLSAAYNIPVRVLTHPEYGTPLVFPEGRSFEA